MSLSCPSYTCTQRLEEQCPYYMAMGMTYEQYWDGDCSMVKAYREAQKIKTELDNQRAWLHGLYIYEAICCVAPILRPYSKAKRPEPYPSEPHELDKERLEQKKAEQRKRDMMRKMEIIAAGINQKFQKKEREAIERG